MVFFPGEGAGDAIVVSERPGSRRPVALTAVLALSVLAACSSSGSSKPGSSPSAAKSNQSASAVLANVPIFVTSGTASARSRAVTLPSKWTAKWRFNCAKSKTDKSFLMNAIPASGKTLNIVEQKGLSGGGQQDYTTAGSYEFAIRSACVWTLAVTPAPPKVSAPMASLPAS